MSQYILNVMVEDYCSIFSVNVLQKYKKYTKYTNLGLALPVSCKLTYIKYKVRSFTPIIAQNENVL